MHKHRSWIFARKIFAQRPLQEFR